MAVINGIPDTPLASVGELTRLAGTDNLIVQTTIENTARIRKVSTDKLTKHVLCKLPFYNVADYGILPDLETDQYAAIYSLLFTKVYQTGGTVYFPKGRYVTSYTIFIPENTVLCGDGEETEIYFDETDTYFGTALANAGSNVTIRNLKVSQKSKGTFHTGAQPGCIGFSDIAKEQMEIGTGVHTVARGEVWNLTAENIVFDGFYPIQTENSNSYKIHNVIYRNLYCPNGCVSVMSGSADIENVLIENVTCDLLRVHDRSTSTWDGYLKNAIIRNVVMNDFYIFKAPFDDQNVVFINLRQTTNERKNDRSPVVTSGVISGNVKFEGCYFTSIAAETRGINLANGIRRFTNCIFDMYSRVVTRGYAASDTSNYEIMENCTVISQSGDTLACFLGYGHGNRIEGGRNVLWGDMHYSSTAFGTASRVSDTYLSHIIVNGTALSIKVFGQIRRENNELFQMPDRMLGLDYDENAPITVVLINTTTHEQLITYAKIISGVMTVAQPNVDTENYNWYMVDSEIQLQSRPTPTVLLEAFYS